MPFGGDLLYWKIISKGILYPRGLREGKLQAVTDTDCLDTLSGLSGLSGYILKT